MRFRRIGDATVAVANGNAVGIAVRQHDDEEDVGEGRAFAARRAIRAIQASGGHGPKLFIRAPRPLGSVERSALLRALVNVIGDEVFGNGRDSVVIDFRPLPPQPKENALDLLRGVTTSAKYRVPVPPPEWFHPAGASSTETKVYQETAEEAWKRAMRESEEANLRFVRAALRLLNEGMNNDDGREIKDGDGRAIPKRRGPNK